jgi:hypothetical protein
MENRANAIARRRQALACALVGRRYSLVPRPRVKQDTPSELDRLLRACESEPPEIKRHIAMLKRRAWWV